MYLALPELPRKPTTVPLLTRWPELDIHALIFCSDERREKETRRSLKSLLGSKSRVMCHFGRLRDGYLPYRPVEAKEFLVDKVASLTPGLVITHYREDLHQDHRFVAELTYQALRDALILEMEIPKYDGDMGRPNVYFPVSQQATDRKISTLMECYPSQHDKHWFCKETFDGLLRLRGLECKAASGKAEAFYATKITIA